MFSLFYCLKIFFVCIADGSLSVLYILCEVTKKMVRVRNNLFYLFFINNTRRYRLNENTDNTNNFPQITQMNTDSYLRTRITRMTRIFSHRLHRFTQIYFLNTNQRSLAEGKSNNSNDTNILPQIAQIYTDSYLRTRTKGRWPKGKAITRMTLSHRLHRFTQIFLEHEPKVAGRREKQ